MWSGTDVNGELNEPVYKNKPNNAFYFVAVGPHRVFLLGQLIRVVARG